MHPPLRGSLRRPRSQRFHLPREETGFELSAQAIPREYRGLVRVLRAAGRHPNEARKEYGKIRAHTERKVGAPTLRLQLDFSSEV
jgi:hypothetical protein